MDPGRNPYAPGAGAPPPELAGRDKLIDDAAIALDRIRNGLTAKSMLLVGLRGVGKTVLLNRISHDAQCRGLTTVLLEAPEDRSLPELLVPPLYAAMVRMSRLASTSRAVRRALQALAGFVSAIKGAGDLNVSLDLVPERGLADSGDLDADLTAVIESVGEAARDRWTALALFIDELQETSCYPYFLQEWGKHCWDCAASSPVTIADVEAASRQATAELDASFFRARFDRLTPSERRYLRAMAELGNGPHRSGKVAEALVRSVRAVAPVRARLIAKGMIYSPAHGDTAFTVPLFDAYLKRVIPFPTGGN